MSLLVTMLKGTSIFMYVSYSSLSLADLPLLLLFMAAWMIQRYFYSLGSGMSTEDLM
jgi:hypothetical protein